MSNRGQVFLFSQSEMTILVLQRAQFEFRQVLRHYCLLQSHLRPLNCVPKCYSDHFHPYFAIIVFDLKSSSFSFV